MGSITELIAANRPTREELESARVKRVPDVIAPNLKVLFVGINPGLYSAATGHHFARPGNRFWPTLYAAGITPRLFSPFEERELLPLGCGITNVVARATAGADELSPDEFVAGGKRLLAKVLKFQPGVVAILGVGAYRAAFDRPRAVIGSQGEPIVESKLWVLPNPSGLNAHYQSRDLVRVFGELRQFIEFKSGKRSR